MKYIMRLAATVAVTGDLVCVPVTIARGKVLWECCPRDKVGEMFPDVPVYAIPLQDGAYTYEPNGIYGWAVQPLQDCLSLVQV